MNFKQMNQSELKEFLDITNKLADVMQGKRATNFSAADDDDARRRRTLDDAEKSAKDYARQRATGGTMPSRDAYLLPEEKTIADQTREWLEKKKKMGWYKK
jgi:hypothetical protein